MDVHMWGYKYVYPMDVYMSWGIKISLYIDIQPIAFGVSF